VPSLRRYAGRVRLAGAHGAAAPATATAAVAAAAPATPAGTILFTSLMSTSGTRSGRCAVECILTGYQPLQSAVHGCHCVSIVDPQFIAIVYTRLVFDPHMGTAGSELPAAAAVDGHIYANVLLSPRHLPISNWCSAGPGPSSGAGSGAGAGPGGGGSAPAAADAERDAAAAGAPPATAARAGAVRVRGGLGLGFYVLRAGATSADLVRMACTSRSAAYCSSSVCREF